MTRVTRILLLTAAAATVSQSALADYIPPSAHDLAGLSAAIVLGHIVEVDSRTFTLRADEVLAGTVDGSILVIERFEDWTCSKRWKPYAAGQREVVFLDELAPGSSHAAGARYRLRSGGTEAEWEVREDHVAIMGFRVPGIETSDDKEHMGQWQWLPLQPVLDALRTYRQCFSVAADSSGVRWKQVVRVLCDQPDVNSFRGRSVFHDYLATTSLEAASKSRAAQQTD